MRKIVLCADDFSYNHAVSAAIIDLIHCNRLSAVSCLTNTTLWSVHANLLPNHSLDLGLHINLTEGTPLTLKKYLPLSRLMLASHMRFTTVKEIAGEIRAQLDRFTQYLGRLPDFIDGHQHVHHLPQVRKALIEVYHEYFPKKSAYIRWTRQRMRYGLSLKHHIIHLTGANYLHQWLKTEQIPHNHDFVGIYNFKQARDYALICRNFLQQLEDGALMMCHPGLMTVEDDDISQSRVYEWQFLRSQDFIDLCEEQHIRVVRFSELSSSSQITPEDKQILTV